MRRPKLWIAAFACLLAVMLLFTACAGEKAPFAEAGSSAAQVNGFSCAAYTEDGRVIQGYWSENEQVWYLFLTSTQRLEETKLYYTGSITSVSAGTLDGEKRTVSAAFQKSGDELLLTDSKGLQHKVIAMQSQLPSVYIDLKDTTLDRIHQDQNVKYPGNTVSILDPQGKYDLTVEGGVEIKGRGNSSWREYEKKSYQIKFHSKTSVLGMTKAKKWVLLANASDDSMLRNQLVYTAIRDWDMAFVPEMEYVDLWVDGEYRGTFLLGEKVELTEARLNLQNLGGGLFEHDENFYTEEPYWFYSNFLGRHFTVKETVVEDGAITEAAMADFQSAVDELMQYLYSTPPEEVTLQSLSAMIDVDSFAKYYLVNEYFLNCESYATSFYWYQDGAEDVLHLGPVWDFDTCMGNDGMASSASYGSKHVLFSSLLAIPEFYERTLQLRQQYIPELEELPQTARQLQEKIVASAQMNYCRWNVLGKPNPKGGADFAQTFPAAVDTLCTWLEERQNAFRVEKCSRVSSQISQDYTLMTIRFRPDEDHEDMTFAVWSRENEKDDLQWYAAQKDDTGAWVAKVSLRNHNSAGLYDITAFANNKQLHVGDGRNYVAQAREPIYILDAKVHQTPKTLTVYMTDLDPELTAVRFAVWGTSAGQEQTMVWLDAQRTGDGYWTAQANACQFRLSMPDAVTVHAYGSKGAGEEYLNAGDFPISEAVTHAFPGDGSIVCTRCGKQITYEEIETLATPIYRLLNPNTAEHFFTGSTEERDALVSYGWIDEGVGWYTPVYFGLPVYRLINPNNGERIYTMFEDEIGTLTQAGWQVEGVSWNSAQEGVPVYRLYNPALQRGTHMYTVSETERDALIAGGWVYETIAWYGVDVQAAKEVG